MYQFLHLRSRLLQTLILGLVVLTFYAYYRTTVYELRPLVSTWNASRLLVLESLHPTSNISGDSQVTIILRNLTLESNGLNVSMVHNVSNASFVTTLNSQPVSLTANASNESKSNVDRFIKQLARTVDTTKNMVNTSKDTARAIYEFGHSVSVPERCPEYGKGMELIVVIMSAPSHVEARTAIRQTWGHFGQRKDVGILFMLGVTMDAKLERVLEQEQNMFADVIRGRFFDSYSNLTLKTISTLEWVDGYCPRAKYLLKTDDDMFINVPRLLSFVNKHAKDKNVIFGRLAKKWKPIRNKRSKYYVSQAQFKPPVFPDFTTGPAYLLSRDVVHKLYDAALDQTYLKLEDVFTTGIVAHKLGIKRAHANEFLNKRISYSPCNVQRGISIHMVKYSEQFELWKKLLDGKTKCK
ncbi:beta-1,3-galactosyltransferase 5-like [Orussus abietinus]|uniref:beta-1,3-galactosyltransferase 5-like n=1 Tax=Orussus abietinus TaxID=222816 RepID=UPI000626AF92|nr:beta-1,3-galactosyltransferase 5-like [Orussus abietinus]